MFNIIKYLTGNNKELFVCFILLSPAIMVSSVRDLLSLNFYGYHLNGFVFIIVFFILFLAITNQNIFKSILQSSFYSRSLVFMIFFVMLCIANGMNETDWKIQIFGYVLTSVAPFFLAITLVNYLKTEQALNVIVKFLLMFSIYLIVNIVYWLFYLNVIQAASSGFSFKRMGGSYASEVILGYTIALLYPLLLYLIEHIRKTVKTNYFIISIFVFSYILAAFLTGSRGAVWFTCVYTLIYIIFTTRKKFIKFVLTLFCVIVFLVVVKEQIFVGKLLSVMDQSRSTSSYAGITYWLNFEFPDKIFGSGFGSIYPYQQWISEGGKTWDNYFYLGGISSVVQPHNSFIWILLECGFLGFLCFFWVIAETVIKSLFVAQNKFVSKILVVIYLFTFIILNGLDSVLIIEPRVATLWWFVLFVCFDFRKFHIKAY